MNQIGFVEVYHVKDKLLYRFQAPLGIPWKMCLEALKDLQSQVENHIKEAQEQEAAVQSQMQKEQYNVEQEAVQPEVVIEKKVE